jgi:hypothetical protein
MKILIAIGMLIVFISVFFIFLTGDAMFRSTLDCTQEDGRSLCTFKGFTGPALFGLFIIGFFILIDVLAVYLIVTNIN